MTKASLYGRLDNFQTQKVLIAAKLANVELNLVGEKPPKNEFPLGVSPAFKDGQTLLFGAEAIALHLLGDKVCKKTLAEIAQWSAWSRSSLLPQVLGFVLPSVSAAQFDSKTVGEFKAELQARLALLNDVLLTRTFLVGERFSLADLSVALDLLPAYQHVLDAGLRKSYGNVTRWFLTVVNQPAAKEVLGEFHLISEASTFDEKRFKELSQHLKLHQSKKEKEAKPAKESAPPAKKDKKKKEDDEDDADAADDAIAQEPKQTDPFADMPKGTFVMDSFKRVYSNEDTATKAIPYFWENFDAEANSIWYCEYKFPQELTLSFMSCNLISGMYQRLEKLKKTAFASVCLFGTDNNSTISGVWIWRGQELVFPLSPDWQIDYESYDWKKLDPKDEATKKLVNEYLLWEGDFGGKKFNQGKIFK